MTFKGTEQRDNVCTLPGSEHAWSSFLGVFPPGWVSPPAPGRRGSAWLRGGLLVPKHPRLWVLKASLPYIRFQNGLFLSPSPV